MKITWCNEERTKAIVQRGFWWWKKVAIVEQGEEELRWYEKTYCPERFKIQWKYSLTGQYCLHEISVAIILKRLVEEEVDKHYLRLMRKEEAIKADEQNWSSVPRGNIPTAVATIKTKET